LLQTLAENILALDHPLIARAQQESGLPEARLLSERARTCNQLQMFAELVREGSWVEAVIETADPTRTPVPKPDIRRMHVPIGPVVVFDASNFPFAFGACGGDTASALAAGNPVIVKSHPAHPGTDEMFAAAMLQTLKDTGLPVGMFSLLHDAGPEIGAALVKHPAAEAVGFTGSHRAGRALFDLASQRSRPIPVFAEMGSVNPLIILPEAMEERGEAIADGLAQSVTMGGGQFCTKPGLAFYLSGEAGERFKTRLTERIAAASPTTLLNASVAIGYKEACSRMRSVHGIEILHAGDSAGFADFTPSLYQITARQWQEHPELREEAFGPSTLLVCCNSLEELRECIESLEGQLTGTIHMGTGETQTASDIAEILSLRVGRLIYNGYPTGVEVCHAMIHGGPYPATTASQTTSVGTLAIRRFTRPIALQNSPDALLPPALQNENPLKIRRMVNGEWTDRAI
jgi:NADP-dependent aldehyde dehydrogenase